MNTGGKSIWIAVAISVLTALALTIVPLPEWLRPLRPSWLALVMIYWIISEPRRVGLLTAWFGGLLLDTLRGALLGEHALALTLLGFVTLQFHLRIRVFPMGQQVATVFMLMTIYEFVLFWVDGVSGPAGGNWLRWLSVISSAAAWPIVSAVMHSVHSPKTNPAKV